MQWFKTLDANQPSIQMSPISCNLSKTSNPFAICSNFWIFKKSKTSAVLEEKIVSWYCPLFREMNHNEIEKSEAELLSEGNEETCRESGSSSTTFDETIELPKNTDNSNSLVRKTSFKDVTSSTSEIETMKKIFARLLLGEDMSGSGNGVCTALAISNAITTLCATTFGQLWKLEPLHSQKKILWKKEINYLLCITDHIVEFTPSLQTYADGRKLEVMTCRARSDLSIDLPALRKLDDMLLDILDSFQDQGYWYIDQEIFTQNSDDLGSFRKYLRCQEDKWWLPIPCIPKNGLSESSRKKLIHKRDCANQILKAAKSINDHTLAEMEVPQSFLSSLPKNGRECLGDVMHSFIVSDQFSDDCLLDALEFSPEHEVLEVANRLEASIFMWQHKNMKKERKIFIGTEKTYRFANRSRNLLIRLKQKFLPHTHTALDMSKTKFNKDVGKSILESYSRVLENIAFNIVARIDDLLYVDGLARKSDHFLQYKS